MVAWLTSASYPSPSAQVDVAAPMGGGDLDTRGIKKNTEPERGASLHHHSSRTGAALGEGALVVQGES